LSTPKTATPGKQNKPEHIATIITQLLNCYHYYTKALQQNNSTLASSYLRAMYNIIFIGKFLLLFMTLQCADSSVSYKATGTKSNIEPYLCCKRSNSSRFRKFSSTYSSSHWSRPQLA